MEGLSENELMDLSEMLTPFNHQFDPSIFSPTPQNEIWTGATTKSALLEENVKLQLKIKSMEGLLETKDKQVIQLMVECVEEKTRRIAAETKMRKLRSRFLEFKSKLDGVFVELEAFHSNQPFMEMCENTEGVQNIVDTVTKGLMDTMDRHRESRQQLSHEVVKIKENLELVLKFIKISSQPKTKQSTSGQVDSPCLELLLTLPSPLPSSNSPAESSVEYSVETSKTQHTRASMSKLQRGHFCTCGVKFISISRLNAHIKSYTKERKFFCPICPLRFVGLNHLKTHMKKIHVQCPWPYPESAVGCRKCGDVLQSREEFRLHIKKVHEVPKNVGIGKLEKASVLKVKPLIRDRDLLKKFPCSVCGDRFEGLGDLRRHLLRVHKSKLRANIVGCRQCGKIFKSLSQLHSHKKTEHNNIDMTGKTLTIKSRKKPNMQRKTDHIKTGVVGKALKIMNRKKLRSHESHSTGSKINPQQDEVVTCTEETPAAETEAEHSFNGFKLSLKTRKSQFLCRCRKSFSKQRYLDDHIKAMEKGRIFSCQLCQSTFYAMRMLRNHYRGKHNTIPMPCFGCKDCGKIFRNFTKLYRHRVENHEVQ